MNQVGSLQYIFSSLFAHAFSIELRTITLKMLNVKTYLLCCSSVSSRRTISAIYVIDICVVAI